MAKFKAEPYYSVHYKAGKINFDHTGAYETKDEGEITALNALCPRYISCVDEGKQPEVKKETEEVKPVPKRTTTRKTSAK